MEEEVKYLWTYSATAPDGVLYLIDLIVDKVGLCPFLNPKYPATKRQGWLTTTLKLLEIDQTDLMGIVLFPNLEEWQNAVDPALCKSLESTRLALSSCLQGDLPIDKKENIKSSIALSLKEGKRTKAGKQNWNYIIDYAMSFYRNCGLNLVDVLEVEDDDSAFKIPGSLKKDIQQRCNELVKFEKDGDAIEAYQKILKVKEQIRRAYIQKTSISRKAIQRLSQLRKNDFQIERTGRSYAKLEFNQLSEIQKKERLFECMCFYGKAEEYDGNLENINDNWHWNAKIGLLEKNSPSEVKLDLIQPKPKVARTREKRSRFSERHITEYIFPVLASLREEIPQTELVRYIVSEYNMPDSYIAAEDCQRVIDKIFKSES